MLRSSQNHSPSLRYPIYPSLQLLQSDFAVGQIEACKFRRHIGATQFCEDSATKFGLDHDKRQGPAEGRISKGGFRIWPCPSQFVFLFFLGLSPFLQASDLSLCCCKAIPEKVRDTIRTFPEKYGKPTGLPSPYMCLYAMSSRPHSHTWQLSDSNQTLTA